MKSPVIGMEVRWREAGSTGWNTKQIPPNTGFEVDDLSRGEVYELEVRNLGMDGMASEWVSVPIAIPDTNRQGAAALPPVSAANVSSRWVSGTAVSYTATDSVATINLSAGVLQVQDKQITYGASSAQFGGAAGQRVKVYLYYDDPQLEGGTRTLGVTTDAVTSTAAYGRVFVTTLIVQFDVAGGGGTGGGGDIGGGGGGSGQPPRDPGEDTPEP